MATKNSKSSRSSGGMATIDDTIGQVRQQASAMGFQPVDELVTSAEAQDVIGYRAGQPDAEGNLKPEEVLAVQSARVLVDLAKQQGLVGPESSMHRAFLRSRGIDPRQPLQLEIWPDDVREMPNDYARSAIFTVRNKTEPRATMQNSPVFHIEKAVRITYTGIELRADDDELVWQQILDYAKRFPLGEPVEFNLHELCIDLGWSINGRNYDKARLSISRLKANELKVENERIGRGVAISLIDRYEFEGDGAKGSKFRIWIHPNLILLFAGHMSTRVTWTEYRVLKPIARRLYDYFASHKQPFPLRLDTFSNMCASSCSSPRKWKSMVKEACDQLVTANLVRKAWVHEDFVYCER